MLLTRSPLSPGPKAWFSLDLHVLSAPPAFVLSQDQTLREEWLSCSGSRAGVDSLFTLSLSSKVTPHRPRPSRDESWPGVPEKHDGLRTSRPRARGSRRSHAVEFSKTGAAGHEKSLRLAPKALSRSNHSYPIVRRLSSRRVCRTFARPLRGSRGMVAGGGAVSSCAKAQKSAFPGLQEAAVEPRSRHVELR